MKGNSYYFIRATWVEKISRKVFHEEVKVTKVKKKLVKNIDSGSLVASSHFNPWLQGLLPALTSLISSSKLFNLQLKPFIWYRQFVAQCLCNRRSPSYYRSRFTFNGCEITINSPFMMKEAEGVRLNLGQRYGIP